MSRLTVADTLADENERRVDDVARHDGPDLDPEDHARLATQLESVRQVLIVRGGWWTLRELAAQACASEAGVSARLRDLRKPKFGAWVVERRRRANAPRGVFEYRLRKPEGEATR